ncbi:MAG TPA: ferric reductase-like transmembrane domain-containing protein [Solirubrobacteraceae bacterium]|nr:ferric reductase-like transmembrane domain-containing protein [Solirubrobacteraceae bacterium]
MSALHPAAVGPSSYWFLARGTGAVALLLLTGSVVLGVLGSVRFDAGPRWPRFTIDVLHRDVSLLVIVFLVLHVLTSVLDGFAPVSLLDAVIPFRGSYRPFWLGLGALSFDLLIALVLTSVLRRRLGYRSWRAIHWLAYASWPIAVFHGLGTGSDSRAWWMLALTGACVAAVLVAVWVRAASTDSSVRAPALAASAAVGVGLAVFTVAGPLQRGWARRSGTPTSLLSPAAFVSTGAPPRPFSATVSGTISQTTVAGGEVVDLALNFTGGARGILRVRLAGAPAGGGLSMTGSQVDLTAVGLRSALSGRVVSLDGDELDARVRDASGSQLLLHAALNIDSQGGTVTGSLVARRA